MDIQEILKNYLSGPQDRTGKPNSDRAEAICQVVELMDNGSTVRFGYWLGRTRHLSPASIRDAVKAAKGFEANPQALFNKIIRKPKRNDGPKKQ